MSYDDDVKNALKAIENGSLENDILEGAMEANTTARTNAVAWTPADLAYVHDARYRA